MTGKKFSVWENRQDGVEYLIELFHEAVFEEPWIIQFHCLQHDHKTLNKMVHDYTTATTGVVKVM